MKYPTSKYEFGRSLSFVCLVDGGFELGLSLIKHCYQYELTPSSNNDSWMVLILYMRPGPETVQAAQMAFDLEDELLPIFKRFNIEADEIVVLGISDLEPELERAITLVLINSDACEW